VFQSKIIKIVDPGGGMGQKSEGFCGGMPQGAENNIYFPVKRVLF
jgi:hypothetical protein